MDGRVSWSELADLVEHLPQESAYRTAVRDQFDDMELAEMSAAAPFRHGPWSRLELLTKQVVDDLRLLQHIQVARAGAKSEPPKPIPVPGLVDGPVRKPRSDAAVIQMAEIRARHRAERVAAGLEGA